MDTEEIFLFKITNILTTVVLFQRRIEIKFLMCSYNKARHEL